MLPRPSRAAGLGVLGGFVWREAERADRAIMPFALSRRRPADAGQVDLFTEHGDYIPLFRRCDHGILVSATCQAGSSRNLRRDAHRCASALCW
jgi:hypothetical protein